MTALAPKKLVRDAVRDILDVSQRGALVQPLDAEARTELEREIVDAFEAGKIDQGLRALMDHAHAPRAEQKLKRLVDSALLSLGVTVGEAREHWYTQLSGLAEKIANAHTPNTPRESPVRDAFRGIRIPLSRDLPSIMRRLSVFQARLDEGLKLALQSKDSLAALRALADHVAPKELPDQTVMGMLTAFADREAWSDVISVYEAAGETFQTYPAPAREYALALCMLNRTEEAREVLEKIVAGGDTDALNFGLLGKIHKERADTFLKKGDLEGAQGPIAAALRWYQRGFREDRTSLYPGINLPTLYEGLDRPYAADRAETSAKALLISAKQRAAYGENRYWDAAAVVECSATLRDWNTAHIWTQRLIRSSSEPWQRKSTLANLERLRTIRDLKGDDNGQLDQIIRVIRSCKGSMMAQHTPGQVSAAAKALQAVHANTYRFGAMRARRLTGNYKFSGIAHDVRVTPADYKFFQRVMKQADLDQVSDPLKASSKIDTLIREHFQTAEMEDRKSEVHRRFDRIMPGLAQLMGAKENSQTNVSADWLNGLGDCRQHAPVKVLLFEAWKRERINGLLEDALKSAAEMDDGRLNQIQNELAQVSAYEMRVLDSAIGTPQDEDVLEEHTMTVFVRRKVPEDRNAVMDELAEIRAADSFYQTQHDLRDRSLEVFQSDPRDFSLLVQKTESSPTALLLKPTHYSNDRSEPAIDFGQLKFRGIQMATPGWEREVPVEGLDLSYLHDHVDAPSEK